MYSKFTDFSLITILNPHLVIIDSVFIDFNNHYAKMKNEK